MDEFNDISVRLMLFKLLVITQKASLKLVHISLISREGTMLTSCSTFSVPFQSISRIFVSDLLAVDFNPFWIPCWRSCAGVSPTRLWFVSRIPELVSCPSVANDRSTGTRFG